MNAVKDLPKVAIGGRFFASLRRTTIRKRTFWTASILFDLYSDLKEAYHLAPYLGQIFQRTKWRM